MQAPQSLLQPLPIPTERFARVSMDFITNLPPCRGYNACFTVVDFLTKRTRLIPCTMGDGLLAGEEVAHLFFAHWVCLFGVPREVVHDRDARFTGSFWREMWRLLGTRTVYSSSHHPQTDGQTKRMHRTLEQCLRCLLAEQGLD